MFRLSYFIIIYIALGVSDGIRVLSLSEYKIIHVVNYHNSCSREDAERWANVFTDCFRNSKFKISRNFFNIVAKLLDHSKRCIKFATLECRPNYDGFLNIMERVIDLIKESSIMHLERLTNAGIIAYAERDKIKDFNCVENSLTKDTYATCFSSVISSYEQLGENETYDLVYQKDVETAIQCTNTAKRQCSKSVKVDMNKVVRYILGVKQPEKEEIVNDRMILELLTTSTQYPEHFNSEFSELENKGIDDNSKALKFSDSTSHPHSTEFLATQKENHESNIENKEVIEISEFLRKKNDDDDDKILSVVESLQSTKPTIFSEQTTMLDIEKSEKEKIMNHFTVPEDSEQTGTPVIVENSNITNFSKAVESFNSSLSTRKDDNIPLITETIQSLKITEIPNTEKFSIFTDSDSLEAFTVAESGKDMEIDRLDWNRTSTLFTDSPKHVEKLFKISSHVNSEKKDKDVSFTESLDALKDHVTASDEEELTTEAVTTDFEDEFNSSSSISKLKEQSKSIEDTKSLKAEDNPIDTTSIKPFLSPRHPKTTMTENILEFTENLKTTSKEHFVTIKSSKLPKPTVHSATSTSTEFSETTQRRTISSSTKLPKPTTRSRITTSATTPKHTHSPTTTSSTKPPKLTTRSRTSTSTKSPKTTHHSTTSTSRKPPRNTNRPTTTTTRRPRTFSSVVRSRSRDDYTPRPTEAPRPWYDFIIRPFVNLWQTVKSWFGW